MPVRDTLRPVILFSPASAANRHLGLFTLPLVRPASCDRRRPSRNKAVDKMNSSWRDHVSDRPPATWRPP